MVSDIQPLSCQERTVARNSGNDVPIPGQGRNNRKLARYLIGLYHLTGPVQKSVWNRLQKFLLPAVSR